jgi:phage terminase large subunit GpA-like protein
MTVDVQSAAIKSRFEVLVSGVTAENKMYILHHERIFCDTSAYYSYNKLTQLMKEHKITHCFIDSGHMTDNVKQWASTSERITPIKGASSHTALRLQKSKDIDKLIFLNVNQYKHTLFNELSKPKRDSSLFFASAVLTDEFINQMNAEQIILKSVGTLEIPVFKKLHSHVSNEALDLMVYQYACNEYTKSIVEVIEETEEIVFEEQEEPQEFSITIAY